MHSFKQFLIESKEPPISKQELDIILSSIRNNCKPYIQETSANPKFKLYRGIDKKETPPYMEVSPQRNRQPVDTAVWMHEAMDNWFQAKFGLRARSQTLFTTALERQASLYGQPYVAFPVGNYQYVWSPKVMDLYQSGHKLRKDDVSEFLDNAQYTSSSLVDAINTQNEVMVKCKSCYLIRSDVVRSIENITNRTFTDLITLGY